MSLFDVLNNFIRKRVTTKARLWRSVFVQGQSSRSYTKHLLWNKCKTTSSEAILSTSQIFNLNNDEMSVWCGPVNFEFIRPNDINAQIPYFINPGRFFYNNVAAFNVVTWSNPHFTRYFTFIVMSIDRSSCSKLCDHCNVYFLIERK